MKKFFLLTLCVVFFLPAMANAAPTASDAIANAEAEAAQPKVKKKKKSSSIQLACAPAFTRFIGE